MPKEKNKKGLESSEELTPEVVEKVSPEETTLSEAEILDTDFSVSNKTAPVMKNVAFQTVKNRVKVKFLKKHNFFDNEKHQRVSFERDTKAFIEKHIATLLINRNIAVLID